MAVQEEEEERSQVILCSKSSRALGYRCVLFRASKAAEDLSSSSVKDEASSSWAVAPQTTKNPYGLTSEALTVLGEKGSQVLLCSGPHHRKLLCGFKPLKVSSAMPRPVSNRATCTGSKKKILS